MYKRAFKKADANGDGIVTKQEIAAQAKEQFISIYTKKLMHFKLENPPAPF
jgi:hypothetical protein